MKLSKIILENKKIVVREELILSNEDINKLTEAISIKLEEYLDTGNQEIVARSVSAAINELVQNNEK